MKIILTGLVLVLLALHSQAQWYSRAYGVDNIYLLDQSQLTYSLQKAESNVKTGKILTLGGMGTGIVGIIISANGMYNWTMKGASSSEFETKTTIGGVLLLAGMGAMAVGIPLWAVNASRRNKIEIALIRFNVSSYTGYRQPDPLGLGLTFRF